MLNGHTFKFKLTKNIINYEVVTGYHTWTLLGPSRLKDTGYRIDDPGFRIQDPEYRIDDAGFRIQDR